MTVAEEGVAAGATLTHCEIINRQQHICSKIGLLFCRKNRSVIW